MPRAANVSVEEPSDRVREKESVKATWLMQFKDVELEADYKFYRGELSSHRVFSTLLCFGMICLVAGGLTMWRPRDSRCDFPMNAAETRCAYTQLKNCTQTTEPNVASCRDPSGGDCNCLVTVEYPSFFSVDFQSTIYFLLGVLPLASCSIITMARVSITFSGIIHLVNFLV
jgi:hypothetical protein